MHLRKLGLFLCGVTFLPLASALADDLSVAANSMNALGIDLLARVAKPDENALLSPYSIQSALAMTYAGAAGETKAEMAKVLHYPEDEAALHRSFAAFSRGMAEAAVRSQKVILESEERGGPSEPLTLEVANRLYGQSGYDFRPEFLTLTKEIYGAPFQPVDFIKNAEKIRSEINAWVAQRTRDRICDLIAPGGLDEKTRLALVNAVYFKAPWAKEFSKYGTKPKTFFVGGTQKIEVPTMQAQRVFGYRHQEGFTAVTIRYVGGELQFLVLLPDKQYGLADLEKRLTAQLLLDCANPDPAELILYLPKFRIEPPVMALAKELQSLGMKTAFDQPNGSANFDRMAPRKPNDYLYVSAVFHKTFIAVDEEGTEAAAATSVVVLAAFAVAQNPSKPIEVQVDRPFLFAIQHRASGACLFLGRVVDPR
ncbi:MAG: serpin family protein [Verrucomicrobia bacterium]|nr:serpin family protein [Verrucomicrobiota bacterium]